MAPTDLGKTLLQRYFLEGWNQGRLDVFDELLHTNFQNHTPYSPNLLPGIQGMKATVALARAAFPDLRFVIEDQVLTEGKIATRCTMYGTHQGTFFGLPPSGKRVSIKQFQIDRLLDGKIVEQWRLSDMAGLLKQIGQTPQTP
ncbi:MAG: ester cyclase [Nitrospiraceae bacterium]